MTRDQIEALHELHGYCDILLDNCDAPLEEHEKQELRVLYRRIFADGPEKK